MEGCFNYHWFGMACICCFRIYKKFEEINDVVVCSETGQNIRMKGDAMEKLTFRKQIIFGLILFIAANVLAFIFHNGIFSNFAWVISVSYTHLDVYKRQYYDYSAEAVTELLSAYLTPKLISLMKEAENV